MTVGGVIVIVNMIGLAAYLSINQELDWTTLMHLLSSYLMIEGLLITLVGCAAFFGFRKYTEWPGEEARRRSEENKDVGSGKDVGRKMNFGVFFVVLGMLLFFLSFVVLSFLP